MNLDLSKASSLECIPVVVLENCGPELSYMPTELFQPFFQAYFYNKTVVKTQS